MMRLLVVLTGMTLLLPTARAEPGKVDVYDLGSFSLVGSVAVGQQAGGIIFWKMEPAAS